LGLRPQVDGTPVSTVAAINAPAKDPVAQE
jgi:hypothetical protein